MSPFTAEMGSSRSKVSVAPEEIRRAQRNPFAPVAHLPEGEFFRDLHNTDFELFRNGTDFIFLPHPNASKGTLIAVKPGPNNANESRNVFVATSASP